MGENIMFAIETQEDVGRLLYHLNQMRAMCKDKNILVEIKLEDKEVIPKPAPFGKRTRGYYYSVVPLLFIGSLFGTIDHQHRDQFHQPVKMVQPKPIRFVIAEDCKIFIDDILATWDDLQDGMECTMYHIRGLIYEIRAKRR